MCEVKECGKSFLRKGHLHRHELTAHLKERQFVCEKEGCNAAFALKHHLTRHAKLHDNPKPFECTWPLCGKAFAKHEQLRMHTCSEHTGEALFKCDKCSENVEFKTKSEYKKHEKMMHGSRVYLCGIEGCGQCFGKWSLVVAHRKSEHVSAKKSAVDNRLLCEECGKGPFKSEASYRQHSKIHLTNEFAMLKHTCPQCEKEFASRSSLKAHVKAVHSTELPFVCEQCDKAYGYKKLLKRHVEKVHMADKEEESLVGECDDIFFRERRLMCTVRECRRRFFRQYDLDRHMQSIHPEVDESRVE